jgi:hypothetical protein
MTFKYEGPGWYVTHGGHKAYVGCDTSAAGFDGPRHPLRGCLLHVPEASWTLDGAWSFYDHHGRTRKYDLIGPWVEPKKRVQGWANIYPKGSVDITGIYPDRDECDKAAGSERIACVYIDIVGRGRAMPT